MVLRLDGVWVNIYITAVVLFGTKGVIFQISFMKGEENKTVLKVTSDIFISMTDCSELLLSNISFIGGKGIFQILDNAPNVRQNFVVTDCIFANQSTNCISSNSSDMPNLKITNCKFIDKSCQAIAIAFVGLTDSFNISNNEFWF